MKEYGIYDLKDDEQCVYIGTIKEVSEFLNCKESSLKSYLSRKRNNKGSGLLARRYQLIEINEDEEFEDKRKTNEEIFQEIINSFEEKKTESLKEEIAKFKIFDEFNWMIKGLKDKVMGEEEIWKKIPQFEYSISNYGHIKNDKNGKLKSLRYHRWIVQVDIYKDGKRYTVNVPRLEAHLFIRKVKENERVVFKDGDRRNLYYKNLKIVSK